MLSHEAILEYQQIYKQEFGIELSYELANEKASEFLRLLKILYKPVSMLTSKGHEK